MDAVMSSCFRQRFEGSATGSAIKALQQMNAEPDLSSYLGERVWFPQTPLSPLLGAIVTLDEVIAEIQGSPSPSLTWAFVLRKPRISRAVQLKEEYISNELRGAVQDLQECKGAYEGKSAVQHMVMRERSMADKEQREPQYFSRVMMDEVGATVEVKEPRTDKT